MARHSHLDPSRGTELVIQSDLTPAAWIEPLLFGDWSDVRAMVPEGFEAYARIFFPTSTGLTSPDLQPVSTRYSPFLCSMLT